ncbi:hypothetical protein ABBQ32_012669 [Trebouxia sp. C0010 RCD-2024]
MRNCPDLSAALADLYDKPLLGPKPNQLLVFKRPQLAVKLESLMQATSSAAAKHMNNSLVNQAIAAMYQHPQLHDHVVGWAPVRSGQLNAEVHLSFKDTSAQHRQQIASAGAIQVTMHGAAAPVSLPVSTVAAKQLPEVTMVRLHNVPGGINVHGLMACLLKHFQFGPEYSVVSEYGGDVSGDIAAVTPTWRRSDVCIAELRAPVQDAKLRQLPAAFTCFGQQVSVSVQPSLLAKAHLYQQRAPTQSQAHQQAVSQSPRQKRRQQQRARAKRAAAQPSGAAVGPRTLVMGGVGLGAAACTSAGSPAGKPTLAANPGSQAWHLGSRGPDLSASSVALPWLSLDPNSGATSSGVKVDSFHASQLCWQGSSQLRRARLTASMDGIVKGPSPALVTATASAASSAAATFTAAPAAPFRQSCHW